ncbi:MAG: YidE/YbjL duplication [Alphaproteobacteria bacterium]|nr:MAG: YidE/YbjL duplication [Alphaproteobacteria bacterium]
MLNTAREIIGTQPILATFLAIGLGYLVGQINLGGFSLGVGAVLFVGLAIGAFAPKAQITGPIGLTGLIMFLYGIGILYGRQFFEGMAGAAGRKYNLLALIAVMAGLVVALGLGHAFGVKIGHTLGIYAGSMTSTATLQAALEVMGNSDPSIGYSLAYPFGVIGPILCIYFMTRQVQPKFPPKVQRFHMGEITLGANYTGQTLADVDKNLPAGVQVTMVRKGEKNVVAAGDLALSPGDGLLLVAEQESALAEAATKLGRLEPGRIVKDRSSLDYIRVFVGKANVAGVPLAQLPMPSGFPTHLLHVRRYDMDIMATPDLMLEFGDRVGVLMPPDRKEEVRRHFGDTVKAAAEFSYVSLGIGMVLGLLLGLIPIPIPGVGVVTLGIGGGPLIVALILGKLRRTGPMLWTMPLPANIVLRNFGLALFLASVGINAGQPFVRTVSQTGFTMLYIGIAVLLTTVIIVLLVGHYLMKIPFDYVVGVASGATGNPAILVYSTRMAPTERPDIGYAMIFPSMTIVKVVAVQVVGLLVASGAG